MRIAGGLSATIYQGCVEDRMDPLKLGRVRVRVLGVHSEDVTQVPTGDLPWAVLATSPTNAGISGIGWSPTGLSLGSWVFVQFADDACQVPIVIGTAYGINPNSKLTSQTADSSTTILQAADGSLGASDNSPSGSISGNVWTSSTTTTSSNANEPTPSDNLGSVSEEYESNGNPGAANKDPSGKGWSYGSWQLNGTNMRGYMSQTPYKSQFAGLAIGTPEFNKKWQEIGSSDATAFKTDQKSWIMKSNYVPVLNKFPQLADRGPCVQNCIWSVAVQLGPPKAIRLINKALAGQDVTVLSNADICTLIKDYQSQTVDTYFPSSTPKARISYQNRYTAEKGKLVAMCGDATTGAAPISPGKDPYGQDIDPGPPVASAPKEGTPLKIGFVDPTGKLPRKGYLGKPDTNRLARAEETQYTLLEFKNRTRVVGNGYEEPKSPYAATYPNNKVYMSEAGHVIEIDDTPLGERIHVWHKSGSYIEFQPDGTIVKKSYKDDHEIVLGEDKTYVSGNMSVFVEGNVSLKVLGNYSVQAEGNISILAGGSLNLSSMSDMDIATGGTLHESAASDIIVTGKTIKQNSGGARSAKAVDVGAKLNLLKTYSLDDTSLSSDVDMAEPMTKEALIKQIGYDDQDGTPPEQARKTDVAPPPASSSVTTDMTLDNPQLSEHYWLSDLTTGTVFPCKLGSDGQAGLTRDEIITNLKGVAVNILEPLVAVYGKNAFVITQALRSISSASVGSKTSQHYTGQAVDVQFPSDAVHKAGEMSKFITSFDQMILEYHSNNPVIHVSYADKLRKNMYTTYDSNFHPLIPAGFYDRNKNLVYKA